MNIPVHRDVLGKISPNPTVRFWDAKVALLPGVVETA
jgi:hypothetical protein